MTAVRYYRSRGHIILDNDARTATAVSFLDTGLHLTVECFHEGTTRLTADQARQLAAALTAWADSKAVSP